MKKYIYFLADMPDYPNEIYARSKAEVKSLILESVPDESHILKIVEAEDPPAPTTAAGQQQAAIAKMNSQLDAEINPDDFADGNSYFQKVMDIASKKAMLNSMTEKQQKTTAEPNKQQTEKQNIEQPIAKIEPIVNHQDSIVVEQAKQPPKIFEEGGMIFKLEDGHLFKKQWVDVSSGENAEFRIKNKTTNKVVSSEKYVVEKLDWIEIQQHM